MSEQTKETVRRWHLDPKISVGHLISTAVLIGTFTVYVHKIDTRLAVNEAQLSMLVDQRIEDKEVLSKIITLNKAWQTERVMAIESRFNRLEGKIDELISRKARDN